MDAGNLIRAIWNELDKREETFAVEAMAEILRDRSYHVAESDAELRELALAETDLVEPE